MGAIKITPVHPKVPNVTPISFSRSKPFPLCWAWFEVDRQTSGWFRAKTPQNPPIPVDRVEDSERLRGRGTACTRHPVKVLGTGKSSDEFHGSIAFMEIKTDEMNWNTRPGKHTKNYGKSPCLLGKSTMSMAIFNSFLYVCQRVPYFGGINIHGTRFSCENPHGHWLCLVECWIRPSKYP